MRNWLCLRCQHVVQLNVTAGWQLLGAVDNMGHPVQSCPPSRLVGTWLFYKLLIFSATSAAPLLCICRSVTPGLPVITVKSNRWLWALITQRACDLTRLRQGHSSASKHGNNAVLIFLPDNTTTTTTTTYTTLVTIVPNHRCRPMWPVCFYFDKIKILYREFSTLSV